MGCDGTVEWGAMVQWNGVRWYSGMGCDGTVEWGADFCKDRGLVAFEGPCLKPGTVFSFFIHTSQVNSNNP